MPVTLATTVSKIQTIPHAENSMMIDELYQYMKRDDKSDRHINNTMKAVIRYALYLAKKSPSTSFFAINSKLEITEYLDTFQKSEKEDPEKKWITTWNDQLNRIRYFFRWMYNRRGKDDVSSWADWETPAFVHIKHKKSKRLSPYSETELWDRDELLAIVKYAEHPRNKAALTLFWDLDARNHEITMLKIKNIRLREQYGEGEIPDEAKTGTGPALLTISFPYVRDWLKVHPFKNDPNARLICSILNGKRVRPDAMWSMMQGLKSRIKRLVDSGEITNDQELKLLTTLLATKRWNPYCFRHSAITCDADTLPGYALNKKVRWSMNSKQPARYIKKRMGQDLRNLILIRDGIQPEKLGDKKPVIICQNCSTVNAREYDRCTKCTFPMTPKAVEEVRMQDKQELHKIREQHDQELRLLETRLELQFNEKIKAATQDGIIDFLKNDPFMAKALMEEGRRRARMH